MKKNVFLILTLFALLSFVVGCQPQTAGTDAGDEVNLDSLRMDIQAMENTYAKAQNEKNPEPIVAFFADDAQRLPAGQPTVKGKDAIRQQVMQELSDTTGATVQYDVVEVFADGDLAVEIGKSTVTHKDGSKEYGKYMAVYEKRDGKWICIRDIWNNDTDDDGEDDANEGGEGEEDGED
jgi:uncharacterized protein (TIGR02246 family)